VRHDSKGREKGRCPVRPCLRNGTIQRLAWALDASTRVVDRHRVGPWRVVLKGMNRVEPTSSARCPWSRVSLKAGGLHVSIAAGMGRWRRFAQMAVIALAGFGLASSALAQGGPTGDTPSCSEANTLPRAEVVDQVEGALLCVINTERAKRGLPPFRRNRRLDGSARFQSSDMAAYGFFAHEAPGHPTLLDRIVSSEYFRGAREGLYSENLAVGPQATASANAVISAWLASPAHAANVFSDLHDIGIGSALVGPNPAFYSAYPAVLFTTDFGTRYPAVKGRSGACHRRRAVGPVLKHRTATPRLTYCPPPQHRHRRR